MHRLRGDADRMKGDLVKKCMEKGRSSEIACVIAAGSMEEVEQCDGRKRDN